MPDGRPTSTPSLYSADIDASRPSNPDFSGLSYLARRVKKQASFANIAHISTIFSNYNALLEMWKTRNEAVGPIFSAIILRHSKTAAAYVNLELTHRASQKGSQ
ncbi:hypothetical protein [Nitrosovibrio tenuis]|uniref:hypothetical protein n=1 Tax=Nitrosovibrio tenuis TaxID=1233 RepID=UPI00115F9E68|nr:hypothetical protein [Nitrosovibrio tenuis]